MMNSPTAEDTRFPSLNYCTENGATMTMLRPYWRERPEITQVIPGTNLAVAMWRDGTVTPVPADAAPCELAAFYSGALATNVLREMRTPMLGKKDAS
jgi:hypothetical protein